jgi:hypothetical protein
VPLLALALVTQTASQQRATGTTVVRLLAGSMRPRPPCSGSETQTTPPATVTEPGARPTRTPAPGQGPDRPPHLGVLLRQLGHGRAPAGQ